MASLTVSFFSYYHRQLILLLLVQSQIISFVVKTF